MKIMSITTCYEHQWLHQWRYKVASQVLSIGFILLQKYIYNTYIIYNAYSFNESKYTILQAESIHL